MGKVALDLWLFVEAALCPTAAEGFGRLPSKMSQQTSWEAV